MIKNWWIQYSHHRCNSVSDNHLVLSRNVGSKVRVIVAIGLMRLDSSVLIGGLYDMLRRSGMLRCCKNFTFYFCDNRATAEVVMHKLSVTSIHFRRCWGFLRFDWFYLFSFFSIVYLGIKMQLTIFLPHINGKIPLSDFLKSKTSELAGLVLTRSLTSAGSNE